MTSSDRAKRRHPTNGRPDIAEGGDLAAEVVSPISRTTVQRAVAAPQNLSPGDIHVLQRTAGNAALVQLLRAAPQPQATQGSAAAPTAGKAETAADQTADRSAFIYVWQQIESEVGTSSSDEEIYEAFNRHAQDMSQSAMFAPAVGVMMDRIAELIADYADGFTVEQMADRAGF